MMFMKKMKLTKSCKRGPFSGGSPFSILFLFSKKVLANTFSQEDLSCCAGPVGDNNIGCFDNQLWAGNRYTRKLG